jgi:hypothetical protein
VSHGYPPRLLRYIAVVMAVAVPVVVGAIARIAGSPPETDLVVGLIVFSVAALVSELKPRARSAQSRWRSSS